MGEETRRMVVAYLLEDRDDLVDLDAKHSQILVVVGHEEQIVQKSFFVETRSEHVTMNDLVTNKLQRPLCLISRVHLIDLVEVSPVHPIDDLPSRRILVKRYGPVSKTICDLAGIS